LVNYAFPLIRYRTGDLGTVEYYKCGCGQQGKMITELIGRGSEYLVNHYNIKVYSSTISPNILVTNAILSYQIEQMKIDDFIVRYTTADHAIDPQFIENIEKFIEEFLYIKNPKIQAEHCDFIPVAENGKMKYLISHIQ
jgi:phenylacetate-CoA ligase